MEYRLNKIDTDIRKKMQEETKSDKIHANEKLNIKKDLKEHDKYNMTDEDSDHKNKPKRYVTIDGIKSKTHEFNVEAEKLDTLSIDNSIGRILDMKK
ncbi:MULTISPECIES: hypothetical protein [Clostridium]|uniref:hypothetical protein n=1 Tax=Clostridium TaxID=1485 RepID=UPI00257ABA37|nr:MULTISPECIES: hypothetical protein [Clostridium]MBS4840286.1 hypothetical protein [Clostridium sp.]MDU1401674.1 hypothetical protein [Clostridium sp.]MDU1601444.1 hypothetical protein [Clostridium sp.]MDU3006462.1 hypothetical protein [Clostridium sp.]MDU3037330.1 hypothetical protein [Clostridium sp.]